MLDPDRLTAYTAAERPDLDERADFLSAAGWPEYNRHYWEPNVWMAHDVR